MEEPSEEQEEEGDGSPVKSLRLEELSQEEIQKYVDAGLFYTVKNHKEHLAVTPYWLSDMGKGVLQELNRCLGKWNERLEAYPVAFEGVRSASTSGAINEDHRWIHVDVLLTFYLYKPQEGQRLRGIIKKIGNKAAICVVFNIFTATVFPQNEEELSKWELGARVKFEVNSFQNRRKGPMIRGKSTKKKKRKVREEIEEDLE